MNIGVDLDDTIANTAKSFYKYGNKFNKEKNIKHRIKRKEWDFDKAFGWNEENTQEFFERYLKELFIGLEPKKDAVESINQLHDEGNKIILITARSEEHVPGVYGVCEDWLKKYKVKVDKIITDGSNKAEKCKENNIDIFIDDSVYHCENVLKNVKIPVFLMDSQYNKKYKNKEIKRVFSWKQILKEIKKVAV